MPQTPEISEITTIFSNTKLRTRFLDCIDKVYYILILIGHVYDQTLLILLGRYFMYYSYFSSTRLEVNERVPLKGIFLMTVLQTLCILSQLLLPNDLSFTKQDGYLYGGAVINFIGQQPSYSAIYSIVIDVQIIMLLIAVLMIRNKLATIDSEPESSQLADESGVNNEGTNIVDIECLRDFWGALRNG